MYNAPLGMERGFVMSLRRAMFVAACMVPFAAGAANAQFQPAPPQQPLQQPLQQPQAQAQPQQAPPCVQEFGKLRDETEKRGLAIRAASEHKAPPKEACALFTAFTAAEAKMLKYAVDNATWCGIPPQIVEGIKKGHARSNDLRNKVCQMAAAPQVPRGPSLSDALGGPVPNSSNIKTGRGGTFDTLGGSPISR